MPELLITYLNDQLNSEYSAVCTYLYYSAIAKTGSIRDALTDFCAQELEHARILIGYITELGADPLAGNINFKKGMDEIELLIFSISEEDAAVNKYTMIVQLIENPKYKTIISETIEMEQKHKRLLEGILARVKEVAHENS